MRSDRFLARATRHPTAVVLFATLLVVMIGFLDLETGPTVRVYPLYFIPAALGAWSARARGGVIFTLLGASVWGATNWSWHASEAQFAFNVLTQLVGFGAISLLTASMRRNFDIAVHASTIDVLTGLVNPRGFYDRTEAALALAARREEPLTLVYLDLDDFKQVNDSQGHHEGDRVLKAVADCIRHSLRGSDIAARLGGDEFALVLVDGDREASDQVIQRFREAFDMEMKKNGWPVKVSLGVLVLGHVPEGVSLVRLMRDVDTLMYEAKERGKNTLVVDERP